MSLPFRLSCMNAAVVTDWFNIESVLTVTGDGEVLVVVDAIKSDA